MSQVSCTPPIDISADTLWQVISEAGAAGRYPAGVVIRIVDDVGVGTLRALTSADANLAVKNIDALVGDTRQLTCSLLTEAPFRSCLVTMAVRNLDPNQTELERSAAFEPDATLVTRLSGETGSAKRPIRKSGSRNSSFLKLFPVKLVCRFLFYE